MKKPNKIYQFFSPNKARGRVEASSIISIYSPNRQYQRGQSFIVPNMAEFIRDVTEYGNIGAIKKRALKLSPPQLLQLIWWNKFNILKIIKKDFSIGVLLLIQLETLKIRSYKPSLIILSDQVTDLSIALSNRGILSRFSKFVQYKLGFPVCIMTNNFPITLRKLSQWKIKPDYIFTPFNRYGYEMNPKQKEVEDSLQFIDVNKIVAIAPRVDQKEVGYLNKFDIKQILLGWF